MVLDPSPPPLGARVAKFRLAKLKESENDALVSVYSDYFFQVTSDMEFFLFDAGHLQNRTSMYDRYRACREKKWKKKGKKRYKNPYKLWVTASGARRLRG